MAVTLSKPSEVREYTPQHLMTEEEAMIAYSKPVAANTPSLLQEELDRQAAERAERESMQHAAEEESTPVNIETEAAENGSTLGTVEVKEDNLPAVKKETGTATKTEQSANHAYFVMPPPSVLFPLIIGGLLMILGCSLTSLVTSLLDHLQGIMSSVSDNWQETRESLVSFAKMVQPLSMIGGGLMTAAGISRVMSHMLRRY